jgi:hypothetical protein
MELGVFAGLCFFIGMGMLALLETHTLPAFSLIVALVVLLISYF